MGSTVVYLFFWFFLSLGVAVYAAARGRTVLGWFLIALAASPVVAFLILLAMPDFEPQRGEQFIGSSGQTERHGKLSPPLRSTDIVSRFEALQQLGNRDLLTPAEYAARKQQILSDVARTRLGDTAEDLLARLIPLRETDALTHEEWNQLKESAFKASDSTPATVVTRAVTFADEAATQPCPNCRGLIHPRATTCMHCWAKVPQGR